MRVGYSVRSNARYESIYDDTTTSYKAMSECRLLLQKLWKVLHLVTSEV